MTPGHHGRVRLVGRDEELVEVARVVEAASVGAGGFALIEGDAGIGKTALLDALASSEAERRAAVVLRGRSWEEGGAPPYWPWVEVAEAGGWDVDWQGYDDPFALYHAVAGAARRAAGGADAPLLVLLDDLHAADEGTLRLTRFVGRSVHDAAIAVVAATRPGDHVVELARIGAHVVLRPLPDHDAEAFIRAAAPTIDAGTRSTIRSSAAGNPLLLGELTRSVATGRPVPAGILDVVAGALTRQPTPTRELIDIAATIGRSFSLRRVADVAKRPLLEVLVDLEPVRAAGDVSIDPATAVGQFSHQLVRDVIHEAVPLPRRLVLHAAIATTIRAEADHGNRAELARHLVAAVPLVDAADAAAACVDAATQARARSAFADAAALLGRARDLTVDADARIEVLLALGQDLRDSGRVGAASAAFEEAGELAGREEGNQRFAVAVLGRTALVPWGRAAADLLPLVDDALRRTSGEGAAGDAELHVRLLARRAALTSMGTDTDRALAEARAALQAARNLGPGNDRVLFDALAVAHRCCWGPQHLPESLHLGTEMVVTARRLGGDDELAEALLAGLIDQLRAGDVRAADAALAQYAELAARSRHPRHQFFLDSRRAMRAFMDGRLAEGAVLLRRADTLAQQIEEPDAIQVFHGAQMVVAEDLRDPSELLAAARMVESMASAGEPRLHLHAAHSYLRAGALDDARTALQRLRRELPALTLSHAPLFDLCLAAEVAAATGERSVGADLWEVLAGCSGFAVVNAGAVTFGGVVDEYLADLAGLLGRPGQQRLLQTALDRYDGMGASWFASRVRRKLDALLQGAAAGSAMPAEVPSERRVALRQLGDHWELEYEGRRSALRDARGLHHLRRLLAAPGREIPAVELVGGGDAQAIASSEARHAVLDEEAKAAYRRRVQALHAELDEADARGDVERSGQARAELDALLDELRRAVGLGGRTRSAATTSERARVTARKAIASAIERVAQQEPEIGRLLAASVRTGHVCCYVAPPMAAVAWELG